MNRLNRKGLISLHALIRAGDYVDKTWAFTAADSNALLGNNNWPEYQRWFLGINEDAAEETKERYAYPIGKGGKASLGAIRAIAIAAAAAGDQDIAEAATEALEAAKQQDTDHKTATGASCDRDISFGAPVKIKAAAGGAGKKLPTFEADAYTGGPMALEGWEHPVVIDYDGIDVSAHARPVLRDHDPKLPLGHTTRIGVVNGILKASGVISASGKHVDEVVDAGKNNFPWQVSVGAKVLKAQFVPKGDSAQANGQTWPGPLSIARQTSLREISLLTLGADDNTSARIAASAAKASVMKFKAWAKAHGFEASDMDAEALKCAKAMYAASVKDGDPEDDSEDDPEDDKKDEKGKDGKSQAASLDIQAAARTTDTTAGNDAAQDVIKSIRAGALGERQRLASVSLILDEYRPHVEPKKFADIEAKAINGEYDTTRIELEMIKAKRPTLNAPNLNTGAGSQADGNIIAAAAARSMGVGEKAAYAGLDERSGNIATSMRGMTLHTIIAASAARLGMHVAPGGINDDFLRDFLRADRDSHRQQIRAGQSSGMIRASSGAGFSTMSLTGITENILYKAMLEAYNLQASVVADIAYERDTNDFKPFKVYRLTASGDFQPLGPGGELKNFSLQDESYSNQVTSRGALLVLKREDIINDDMGALMQSPQVLGRKAALNREKTVMTTLLSGLTTVAPGSSVGKTPNGFNFFSNGAKNYLSGAGTNLSLASLQLAEQKFLQQSDANGDPIGILPDRLLVGPENKVLANNIFKGASIVVSALGSTTGKSLDPNYNSQSGNFRPIVSPYLGGASSIAGATATQWALLPSPAGGMATVQVGYLRGQRTPIIRQVDTDAGMVGIAFQALYDFGVALLDYRCGVFSAGQ